MSDDVRELIKRQHESRFRRESSIPSIKVNLYTGYETRAIAAALDDGALQRFSDAEYLDCVMVADSYLTTHLGRTSTRLETEEEREWFLDVMLSLISEVKAATRESFSDENRPYVIGDMPDGSNADVENALRAAALMVEAGADTVKLEIGSDDALEVLEQLARSGVCVLAHLGFVPQSAANRRYGATAEEALSLFARARAVRDCGAVAIVLERVTELVNHKLCAYHDRAIPIYSIFSGKSPYGGQSLNVWDSVFIPPFKAKFFPPTARHEMSAYPGAYTQEVIEERFSELLKLALTGEFPLSPPINTVAEDARLVARVDPWSGQSS